MAVHVFLYSSPTVGVPLFGRMAPIQTPPFVVEIRNRMTGKAQAYVA